MTPHARRSLRAALPDKAQLFQPCGLGALDGDLKVVDPIDQPRAGRLEKPLGKHLYAGQFPAEVYQDIGDPARRLRLRRPLRLVFQSLLSCRHA